MNYLPSIVSTGLVSVHFLILTSTPTLSASVCYLLWVLHIH